ncbi:MAG TPA: hypothetical protein VF297_11860 [Pyrinomonadaceae bacterium]
MANQTRRVKPESLGDDEEGFAALQAIAGYAPVNQAYTVEAIAAARARMQSAWTTETQADAAQATARDNSVEAEWDFHNLMLGAKDQVKAQFGRDSNEVQALKMKKSSERKSPRRGSGSGGSGA